MATQHPWQSASSHDQFGTTNANDDLESGVGSSIPLKNLRQGGTKPSQAAELSERINEDLKSGRYDCPICSDTIASESPMWSCSACFYVYHYDCVNLWSSNQLQKPQKQSWNCPTCKKAYGRAIREARCWCRKQKHLAPSVFDNSCGVPCNRIQRCDERTWQCRTLCSKQCHPGPCQTPVCMPGCIKYRALKEHNIQQGPTTLNQGSNAGKPPKNTPAMLATPNSRSPIASAINGNATNERRNARDARLPLPVTGLVFFSTIIGVFHVSLGIWCYYNTLHRSQHINYQHFTDKDELTDTVFAWLGGLTVLPILWLFTILILMEIRDFIYKCLELGERDRASGKVGSATYLLDLVTRILMVVAVLGLPIAREAAPRHAFRAIMKHSCEGFDTRFNLGDVKHGKGDDPKMTGPSWSGSPILYRSDTNHFNLVSSSGEKAGTYRMTVQVNSTFSKVIEIDFFTKRWSINNHNITKFSVYRPIRGWSRGGIPQKGKTQVVPAEIIQYLDRKGTWQMTGPDNSDLVLPELNLTIPYMWQFTSDYKYQPYIQVFRHDGMDALEIDRQSRARWTPESADNVVMRTASFGYGMHDLEVCARRKDYVVGGAGETREGLNDDALVPVALMAAVRRQKAEWKGHSFLYSKKRDVRLLEILEEAGLGGQFDEMGKFIIRPGLVHP